MKKTKKSTGKVKRRAQEDAIKILFAIIALLIIIAVIFIISQKTRGSLTKALSII